ncbi:MAG: hypothetical protein NVSMB18_09490 [Acetobacteraceae bacterium]
MTEIEAAPAEDDVHTATPTTEAAGPAVPAADDPQTDAPIAAATDAPVIEGAASAAEPDDARAEVKNGFVELGLSPEIVRAVGEKGYVTPTPIQAQAIPTILMGRDVLGTAQTGTGKTGSFVLPMLDILSGSRARARMPRSLILEPTRELALQVAENFVQYGKYLKLTHALLIGGESLSDQKEVLMRGVDVLIATPGRLMDLFERGGLLLTDTALLVIDEADRMLDMGFIPDVEMIVGFLPKTRQTLFFSATMAPEIRRLADAFLQNPKEIAVDRAASVATTIVAGLTVVEDLDKREALRRLIRSEDVQNALIFCNRKRDVDILFKSLKRHDFSVGSLHGDMSQPERFATLARFKAGEVRLLVCSDVAARGIDIGGLSHVFNFDVPIHAEDYVHRIGRTGRAGLTGHAYTLAAPDDRGFVDAIEKLVGAPIPRIQVEGFDPVEFTEDDGKRRRGRSRVAKPAKPKAKAETLEDATAIAVPVPKPRRRSRSAAAAASAPDAPQPDVIEPVAQAAPRREARAEPSRREDTPREDNRRGESRREEPRRDESRRDEARRDEPRREPARAETRRDEPRSADRGGDRSRDRFRDRGRRDDDLGPAVLGFGDEVPAFMLLRARATRPQVESLADAE